ncbi:polysaccharide deacetylase family protein [Flavobacterium gelidilacus]|uniref:polysaccharide deacetylase family protein n=1 Tax=Flavobacterium gelidilacus TaxID=206041 RepID=UPI0004028408|nr:polysaccharide deacetylase family protein [Flavobacterium gelidilacus]
MKEGNFIISLDFELHWGAAEKWDLSKKKAYFDATRESVPLVLNLFKKYEIHATWATVGFLFANNKKQLLDFCPVNKPTYNNNLLSYYNLIDNNEVGKNEEVDPYHFAPSLISLIINTPNQELATHTFAHYYCTENGQNKFQFDADLKAAQQIALENFNYKLKSLVFPRNQFNNEYLYIAKQNGIKVVRSNPNVWFWKSKFKFIALARAFDTLFSISKSLTFNSNKLLKKDVLLLPASRFFRPYVTRESRIQSLKINRIKKEMTYAAKNNRSYHLWWHPHNFGYSTPQNLLQLEDILNHYQVLNKKYGLTSKTMLEMDN